jgi:uncharacterized protein
VRIIGVISDTHGLLREEAVEALAGSELILHAGDVGDPAILDRLAEVAPVRAVRGNTDWGALAQMLPETEVVDLAASDGVAGEDDGGPLVYLLHDLDRLDLDPVAAGFRMVITGHTHRPVWEERGGVMYLNPGSAGPRRSGLPVSVARLRVDRGQVEVEMERLEVE